MENAIESGSKPEELITYASNAKVARNWNCYDNIVKSLINIEDDETLIVQSGKPVLVGKTHKRMPRVIHANCLLLGRWDNPETRHHLEEKGLTMFGSVIGATWQWNLRDELLLACEVLKLIAKENFNCSLQGKLSLSAGLGSASHVQPLACKLHGGTFIIVEADEYKIRQRKKEI